MIQKVSVIGAGRLAWSLIPNLQRAGLEVVQLISRSAAALEEFEAAWNIPHTSTRAAGLLPEAAAVWLAVPDQAIAGVAAALPPTDALLIHSSGSTSLAALQGRPGGVIYPLQIFTRQRVTDFRSLPLFIEASGGVSAALHALARRLSPTVYPLDTARRLKLHLGAVLACNFSNLMFRLAAEQLPPNLDFGVYEALLREHIDNVFALQPAHTQTGPAIRGDLNTIHKHLELLKENPQLQQLYLQLSRMINPEL
ncbi:MAG: DUF2520 domain-containing protein [Bacteroidetes bacterium]|nr:MAG: DUF2520 domain-containing protein [Bacteroidota bacterium]